MVRGTMLLMALLAAASASGQTVGPAPSGGPPAAVAAPSPRRFELGFVYGFARFTDRHGGVAWCDGAPASGDMDLETSPSLGAALTWAVGSHVRFGVGASRQATRLEVTDETGATSRTDLVLLHLHLDLELAFGGGAAQPLLTLGGGGMQARAEDGSGEQWHYSAAAGLGVRFAVDPRVALRLLARVPMLWANGDLVLQVEPAAGASFLF